jgi:phage tail sheath protein FI
MSLTIETTKPGVTAVVNAGQVSRPIERQPSSTAFIIGFAIWGPIGVAKVITSWAEFRRVFGGFHALGYLAEAAYIFFNLYGGKQIVAVRGGDADTATKASSTRNNRGAGEPVPTFKFEAKYPSLTVDISVTVADTADTNKCDITITSEALDITEKYLSADIRIAGEIATINAASKLVNISLIAATVAGATGRPAAGTFSLTGGDDGSGGMTADDLAPFLSQFENENFGTGQVLIPGHFSSVNHAALNSHAENYNRLALLDPFLGLEYDDAATAFELNRSAFAAAYYPWVEMLAVDGSGVKKFYPPSIFAAGACAKVDRTIGTHKAPANLLVPNAVDVERNDDGTSVINDNVREYLNGKDVNVIAPISNEGIKIYGARVLAPAGETRVQFVHERRMLNLIYYSAKIGYAWAVFATVDAQGRFFRDLVASGKNFLRGFWRDGALYGRKEEDAFLVVADENNNPPEELALGRVHVQIGVKLSPTAEVIIVNIDSVPLSQDLSVLQN